MSKMNIDKLKEQFLNDVKDHTIESVEVNGVNRNVIFSEKGSSTFRFGLTTWPGHLCIWGDMGTSVFSRLEDMFRFFRMDKNDFNNRGPLSINPSYWHEKLQSVSRFGGDKEFSKELFTEVVTEEFNSLVEDNEIEKDEADALWEEIQDEVLNYLDDESEDELIRRGMDFKSEAGYEFSDFWEHSFKEYTHHFIWQLYAIVWGIQKFDEYIETAAQMQNILRDTEESNAEAK